MEVVVCPDGTGKKCNILGVLYYRKGKVVVALVDVLLATLGWLFRGTTTQSMFLIRILGILNNLTDCRYEDRCGNLLRSNLAYPKCAP